MKKQEAADLLDLVIERAPQLRELGVTKVDAGGLVIEFAPFEPDAPEDSETPAEAAAREEQRLRSNMWTDPDTFGREEGVPVNDPRKKG